MAVIRTEKLSKVYQSAAREVRALDDLTLEVGEGEIFGYLGPNSAGKTTTIRLLLDLIRPTTGQVTVLGLDAQADSVAIHRRVGFLPGELNLWKNQTGRQVVNFVARVRGCNDEAYVKQLIDRLQLDLSLRIRSYSTGNRRKLGLLLAMMHRPDLLILDEPTSGLDPLMQQTFNDMMREVRNEGGTVFLSSHDLSEVQAICDRVGILRQGQLKAVECVTDLTQAEFRYVSIQLRVPSPVGDRLSAVPGVTDISQKGETVNLRLAGDFDPLLRALHDCYVVDIRVRQPTLEEIFLTYYDGHSLEAR